MSQEQPFLQQVRNTANVTLDVLLSDLSSNIGTAYDTANLAIVIGEAAFAKANLADADAATALGVAEAAYAQANTGVAAAATAAASAAGANVVAKQAYAQANVGVSASGVTAGSYGSGSQIPVFTVDSRGRITIVTTTAYNLFTPSSSGIVPASGGGTANFLRADGNWAAPQFASAQSLTANGNIQLSGGLVLQWGQFASSVNGGSPIQTTPFSLAFNNNALFVVAVANGAVPIEVLSFTRTQFVWAPSFGGGAAGATSAVRYFAIGF